MLEQDAFDARRGELGEPLQDLSDGPGDHGLAHLVDEGVDVAVLASPSMRAVAFRRTPSSSAPTRSRVITEKRTSAGSRPTCSQAAATRSLFERAAAGTTDTTLYSSAHRAASAAERGPAPPPTISGGCGSCSGHGSGVTASNR